MSFRDRLLQEDEVAAVKWENVGSMSDKKLGEQLGSTTDTKEREGKGVELLL